MALAAGISLHDTRTFYEYIVSTHIRSYRLHILLGSGTLRRGHNPECRCMSRPQSMSLRSSMDWDCKVMWKLYSNKQ